MDLGAYVQIGDFEEVAKKNGIDVPRLRGYRLMSCEKPLLQEEINEMIKAAAINVCESLCCSNPFWKANACVHEYSLRTDYIREYYMVKSVDEKGYTKYTDIRWDRIHGKKRKILKLAIKQKTRKIRDQYNMWNKYAGKENILYIHARIGGGNWLAYGGDELKKQPWFLEKVDDYFDHTYCDIYAEVNGD